MDRQFQNQGGMNRDALVLSKIIHDTATELVKRGKVRLDDDGRYWTVDGHKVLNSEPSKCNCEAKLPHNFICAHRLAVYLSISKGIATDFFGSKKRVRHG